jgi:hypothetical protein
MILFELSQKHQLGVEMLKCKPVLRFLLEADISRLQKTSTFDFITHGRIIANKRVLYFMKQIAESEKSI